MKNNANEKGITLVALVVTIIVLLILAGVSLSLVLGDNGIITRAQDAVTKYKEAEANEQWQMDNFMANYEGGDAYARALQQKGLSVTATENGYLAAEYDADGKNVKLYHYDNSGNVTETEIVTCAPENYFNFDISTGEIKGFVEDKNIGVYYEKEAGGFFLGEITKYLIIPDKINGHVVRSIKIGSSSPIDWLKNDIDTVILPTHLEKIEASAFYDFGKLKTIALPNSVKSIGERSFQDCYRLESIVLPSGLVQLGDYCFLGCSTLKRVVLPESLESLGKYCFDECAGLEYISVGSNNHNFVDIDRCSI